MKAKIICLVFCCFLSVPILRADDFSIVEANRSIPLVCLSDEAPLPAVVEMWQADMKSVFGCTPKVEKSFSSGQSSILIAVPGNPSVDKWLQRQGVEVASISGKWEYFRMQYIEVKGRRHLLILGSDAHGAAYGLLELSRWAGVSPWVWWADASPEKKDDFTLPADFRMEEEPSVRFRGIFINDEDFALVPWVTNTLVKGSPKGRLGPEFYTKVFQLILRLRANLLWPAMHDCSTAFYAVDGNLEAAKQYGIYIGTSHCEPLMRNNVAEWNAKDRGDYDYTKNAEQVRTYWQERLNEVKGSPCVYTLGMRGIHDGKMQGAKTLSQQTDLLQQVLNDQREMLQTTLQDSLSRIPQVFIPYKEVLDVYKNGLEVPEDVTLIWCDDNYGYIRQLSSPEEQLRSGGAGVYYHVSYWGRPHDYLWLASTSPSLIYTEMDRAWHQGARQLWVLNVGDIKPSEYLTEFFLDMAWSVQQENIWNDTTMTPHLYHFMEREFGREYAGEITEIMRQYYLLAYQRKPEFTAWTKVEESKAVYPKGWTPVSNSDWSESAIWEHLQQYQAIESEAGRIADNIDELYRDTYYQLVQYPVFGASFLNQKNLYAELSRRAFEGGRYAMARDYADKSLSAYRAIQRITDYYNDDMSAGKWHLMMNRSPRNLYVFDAPVLPKGLDSIFTAPGVASDAVLGVGSNVGSPENMVYEIPTAEAFIQLPAMDAVSTEGLRVIPDLGYSGHLLLLSSKQSVDYEVVIPSSYADTLDIIIYTAPNHAADGGSLRYEVSVDGASPLSHDYKVVGRSEAWKRQVLANQSAFRFRQALSEGRHRLTITAVDDDIRLDRILIQPANR